MRPTATRPRRRPRGARAHARAARARRAVAQRARRDRHAARPPCRRTSSPSTASTTPASCTPSPPALAARAVNITDLETRLVRRGRRAAVRDGARGRAAARRRRRGAERDARGGGRRAGRRGDGPRPSSPTSMQWSARSCAIPHPALKEVAREPLDEDAARSRGSRRTSSTRWTPSGTASGSPRRSSASWCGWSSSTSPGTRRRRRARTAGWCWSTRGRRAPRAPRSGARAA